MTRVKIRTIHEVIADLAAKRVLAVSERFDIEHIWEDGQKIDRLKYRNLEGAFLAALEKGGIGNTPIAQGELQTRAREIRKKGGFDMAIVMGELAYQNIVIASRLRQLGFKKPIFVEITKDSANITRDIGATLTSAQRSNEPGLLVNLVYLTKMRPSPSFLDFDIDLPVEVVQEKRTASLSRKQKAIALDFIQQVSDLAEPPARTPSVVTRVIRDTHTARELKARYEFRCQVCGATIGFSPGPLYVEAHHIRPLGGVHRGTDTNDNMLVVCPNHHAILDYGIAEFVGEGVLRIGKENFVLTMKHAISSASTAYHNEKLRLTAPTDNTDLSRMKC